MPKPGRMNEVAFQRVVANAADVAERHLERLAMDKHIESVRPQLLAESNGNIQTFQRKLMRSLREWNRRQNLTAEQRFTEDQQATVDKEAEFRANPRILKVKKLPAPKVLALQFEEGRSRRPLLNAERDRFSTIDHAKARLEHLAALKATAAEYAVLDAKRVEIVDGINTKTAALADLGAHPGNAVEDAAKEAMVYAELQILRKGLETITQHLQASVARKTYENSIVNDPLVQEAHARLEFADTLIEWAQKEKAEQAEILRWKAGELEGVIRPDALTEARVADFVYSVDEFHNIVRKEA